MMHATTLYLERKVYSDLNKGVMFFKSIIDEIKWLIHWLLSFKDILEISLTFIDKDSSRNCYIALALFKRPSLFKEGDDSWENSRTYIQSVTCSYNIVIIYIFFLYYIPCLQTGKGKFIRHTL